MAEIRKESRRINAVTYDMYNKISLKYKVNLVYRAMYDNIGIGMNRNITLNLYSFYGITD